MKRNGIRRELFLSHVGVALISLIVITLLVNAVVVVTFGGYVRDQQKVELQAIAEELSAAYSEEEGWPVTVLMAASHRAMMRNQAVRITDAQGQLVWDSSAMNHMPLMGGGGKSFEIAYQAPIVKDGVTIGFAMLGDAGGLGGIYGGQEKLFLQRINMWLWFAFLLVLFGVYFFSKRLSLRISRPLLSIKDAAEKMTSGNLQTRVHINKGQAEIRELGDALNSLAEKLERQELLRKTMTADIAHELRTPVAAIRSYIEAFQDGIWEPTPEKLDICHRQIMQLSMLIQDLEKLSDAENPSLKLDKEPHNVVSVINEAHASVEEFMGGQDILYTPPVQQEVILAGDYRRLLQIFTNLIGNAYKYTPSGGTVTVRILEEDPRWITVQIADTGPGIPADELPLIFERFYRGEKSRNRKLGGAGIGLAVVKALTEAHGGTVSVESKVQEGSIFSVKLHR